MESGLFLLVTSFFSFWIIRYYQFDKEVVRELLGKKLTGRLRKDLDDISEKTNIPLKSCRQQVGCYWWIHGLGQKQEGGGRCGGHEPSLKGDNDLDSCECF